MRIIKNVFKYNFIQIIHIYGMYGRNCLILLTVLNYNQSEPASY